VTAVWGARGTGDGELDGPQGVALDADGRLLVADEFNDRLQIFGPVAPTTPPPVPPAQPKVAPGPSPAAQRDALTLSATTLGRVHGIWRAGVALTLTCSQTCLASVRVQLPAADARRLGLSTRTVGRRSVRLSANRPRHVALRVRPGAMRAAARLRLVVTAADTAGSRARIDRRLFGSLASTH
jgi:hypothetical protein